MKNSTAYNHYTRLLSRLSDKYAAALVYHPTCDELIKTLIPIWTDPALLRCPKWVRGNLSAVDSEKFHNIQHNWVVWMFENSKGEIVSYEGLTDDEKAIYRAPDKTGKHYWLKKEYNPKPFRNVKAGDNIAFNFTVTDKPF